MQLPPGQSAAREFRGYLGPKETQRLEELGSGLIESIDLGWSWVAPLTRLFGWPQLLKEKLSSKAKDP